MEEGDAAIALFVDAIGSQQAWLSILILAAASFIQATVGFAAALFGLPLLLWAGNDLMSAQVMIITAMLPQNLFAVWKFRRHIEMREVAAPMALRLAGLPIGIYGLTHVLQWSPAQINQLVGFILLLAVLMQGLVGIQWKSADRWYWIAVIFGGSGVLQGLTGMSGPPMVLWVHGRRMSIDRARAFLFTMYIANFPVQILLLAARYGTSVWKAMMIAALAVPGVMLGAVWGLRLGSWLGEARVRPLSYIGLLCLALYSLLWPVIRSWWNW
ncbi:MAG: membrane protein [Pirellulaceae bacterium]|nr:MAG: membrane protein [Pirellulaceae bacterium]